MDVESGLALAREGRHARHALVRMIGPTIPRYPLTAGLRGKQGWLKRGFLRGNERKGISGSARRGGYRAPSSR